MDTRSPALRRQGTSWLARPFLVAECRGNGSCPSAPPGRRVRASTPREVRGRSGRDVILDMLHRHGVTGGLKWIVEYYDVGIPCPQRTVT